MIRSFVMVLVALGALGLGGCQQKPDLSPPEVLVSPYAYPSQPLWAVAPLRNESGASIADVLRISDALMAKTAEVKGLSCLPLNRTIAAMRALQMPMVNSAEDARRLCEVLGADAIIVGSITAYDPYDPPKLGLTLALYDGGGSAPAARLDPRAASSSPVEVASAGVPATDGPLNVISEYLDAANHEVLMNVKRYSQGRHDDSTALGWKQYLASMDLYTEFAAYWSVDRLLNKERLRMVRSNLAASNAGRP